mmetsp:Transcript_8788/g.35589  ORF Transcript_8788/g.35589 Transcript_8788/m.35589 type:complete len:232 (+) Transcript_8788:411-1106(+)
MATCLGFLGSVSARRAAFRHCLRVPLRPFFPMVSWLATHHALGGSLAHSVLLPEPGGPQKTSTTGVGSGSGSGSGSTSSLTRLDAGCVSSSSSSSSSRGDPAPRFVPPSSTPAAPSPSARAATHRTDPGSGSVVSSPKQSPSSSVASSFFRSSLRLWPSRPGNHGVGFVPTLRILNPAPSFTTRASTCTLDTPAGSRFSRRQHARPIGTTGPASSAGSRPTGGHANGSRVA